MQQVVHNSQQGAHLLVGVGVLAAEVKVDAVKVKEKLIYLVHNLIWGLPDGVESKNVIEALALLSVCC